MVVFTCNHCGESLHKPKVEKHYQFTCRNYKSVTCVDCFKDFRDDEYVAHTKCVTEDERYAAKGTYKNGIVKKGDVKQESWLDMIKSICEAENSLKPSVRNLLNTILEYSNVPRKKQKFMNFIKSSSGNRANMKDVEEVWDIIEKYKAKKNFNTPSNKKIIETENPEIEKNGTSGESEQHGKKRSVDNDNTEASFKKKKKISSAEVAEESSQNSIKNTSSNETKKLEGFKGTKGIYSEENGSNNVSEQLHKSKKKKNKHLSAVSLENSLEFSETPVESTESLKFNFKEKILDILREKQSISHKKLQKKILKAFVSATGANDCEEKIIKKFNKKLKKIPNVGIEDDKVTLK